MFPRKLPRRLPAFLAVWGGQRSTEAALVDLKGLAVPAVIVHLPAMLRPAAGIGSRPIFQVRVVGADGNPGSCTLNFIIVVFWRFFNPVFTSSAPLICERGLFRLLVWISPRRHTPRSRPPHRGSPRRRGHIHTERAFHGNHLSGSHRKMEKRSVPALA